MHFRVGRGLDMDAQRCDDGAQPAGVQFGTPVPSPLVGQRRSGSVDGLGNVAQVLLGVVDVNDFDGAGKLFGGDVPSPRIAFVDDDLTVRGVEAALLRLAMDTLGEGKRLRVGVGGWPRSRPRRCS